MDRIRQRPPARQFRYPPIRIRPRRLAPKRVRHEVSWHRRVLQQSTKRVPNLALDILALACKRFENPLGAEKLPTALAIRHRAIGITGALQVSNRERLTDNFLFERLIACLHLPMPISGAVESTAHHPAVDESCQ